MIQRVLTLGVAVFLVLAVPMSVVAQSAVLPIFEILDSQGDSIGPVAGFDPEYDFPIVRFVDSDVGVPVMLRVFGKRWLRAYVRDTYFDAANCSGNAYHYGLATQGLNDLFGYLHTVARSPSGGNQMIFRSDARDSPSTTSFASRFDSGTNTCVTATGSVPARPATFVFDLDSEYPPDYVLAPL